MILQNVLISSFRTGSDLSGRIERQMHSHTGRQQPCSWLHGNYTPDEQARLHTVFSLQEFFLPLDFTKIFQLSVIRLLFQE